MKIYLRTLKRLEGVSDAPVTEGLNDKLLGIKLVIGGNLYYIEEEPNDQLKIRTLDGQMSVKPLSEDSVMVTKV